MFMINKQNCFIKKHLKVLYNLLIILKFLVVYKKMKKIYKNEMKFSTEKLKLR